MAPYRRQAARVVLIDAAGRVLLLHFSGRPEGAAWITSGGGVEYGETAAQAAARELLEEVGLRADDLGAPIWHGEHAASFPADGD